MDNAFEIYVKRENIENEFSTFLSNKQKHIWSIHGPGGIGKSTLINRFFKETKDIDISSFLFDYPKHKLGNVSGLEVLLYNLVTNDCPNFEKVRDIIHKKYISISSQLTKIGNTVGQVPINSINSLISEFDKDENFTKELGLIWSTILGAIKLISNLFNQDNKHAQISNNPELHLITALLADIIKTKKGVVFIDTYENLKDLTVVTTLHNIGNELVGTGKEYELAFDEYVSLLLRFLYNKKEEQVSLKAIIAGKFQLNKFANISLFFIKQSEVTKLEPEQIVSYFMAVQKHLPTLPLPADDIVVDVQQITSGNPLILQYLIQFIIIRYENEWTWDSWDSLKKEFIKSDEEFGLIYFLTDRIASQITGWTNNLWKLTVPLNLTLELAEILFPQEQESEVYGKAYFNFLYQNGILRKGKGTDANTYYLFDEVKNSLEAYVKKEFGKGGVLWSNNEKYVALNLQLAAYFKNQKGNTKHHTYYIYHQLQTILNFEEKSNGTSKNEFARLLLGSISLGIDYKEKVLKDLPAMKKEQVCRLIKNLKDEIEIYTTGNFSVECINYIRNLAMQGELPTNFRENEGFFIACLTQFPNEAGLLSDYAVLLQNIKKDYKQAEEYYLKAIAANPTSEKALGNYAVFLKNIKKDYKQAEEYYYLKAIAVNPQDENALGNYALFLENIKKDYEQAEEYYLKAIAVNPQDENTLGNYALFLHENKKDYQQAEEYYLKAIAANPEYENALGNYAVFLKNIKKDYEQAEEYYLKAIAVNPQNENALGNYALFLHEIKKDYQQAEEYYLKAIAANPTDEYALSNYAILLQNIKKDYEQAEEYYLKAIAANPTGEYALGNYALFLKNIKKDYEQAEKYYLKAIAANPTDESDLVNYAIFLEDIKKDYKQAEEYYLKAIAANPTDESALKNYAVFLKNIKKDYEQAEEYYLKAIAANPKYENALGNYAVFLEDIKKDYQQAEEYYLKAIAANPTDESALNIYALFLHEIKKDYEQAEEYYLKAIAANPTDESALNNYAILLQNIKKDYEQAEEYYLKAIAANPTSEKALGNYAVFLEDIKKDYKQAEEYYLKAIAANPTSEKALHIYAIFLEHIKKDYEQAEEYYLKAIAANPRDESANMNLGFFYFVRGNLLLAKKYLLASVSLGSLDLGNMNLGHVYFCENKLDKAIETYEQSIKYFENKDDFFTGFEEDYEYMKQYEVEAQAYEKMKNKLIVYSKGLS
jgi:tetratricopeptide (TPR) repeat protein